MTSDPKAAEARAALRVRAAFLADLAARAVTEPRLFHEDADRQHDLGVAIADVRRALSPAGPEEPREGLRLGPGSGSDDPVELDYSFLDEAATTQPDTGAEKRLRAALDDPRFAFALWAEFGWGQKRDTTAPPRLLNPDDDYWREAAARILHALTIGSLSGGSVDEERDSDES